MSMRLPLPLLPTLVVFVAVVTMLRLGVWQLERGEEKRLRLAQIEARQSLNPFTLAEILAFEQDIRDLPVSFEGRGQAQNLLLLDNRIVNGQVGYEVVLPVKVNQGLLLVNLGWVKGMQHRSVLPEVDLSSVAGAFEGKISVPALNPVITETTDDLSAWPRVVQQLDLTLFQSWFEETLLPFVVLSEGSHPPFVHNWKPVVMSPDKHLAYAIQWFGLALACAVIYGVALRKRSVYARKKQ